MQQGGLQAGYFAGALPHNLPRRRSAETPAPFLKVMWLEDRTSFRRKCGVRRRLALRHWQAGHASPSVGHGRACRPRLPMAQHLRPRLAPWPAWGMPSQLITTPASASAPDRRSGAIFMPRRRSSTRAPLTPAISGSIAVAAAQPVACSRTVFPYRAGPRPVLPAVSRLLRHA